MPILAGGHVTGGGQRGRIRGGCHGYCGSLRLLTFVVDRSRGFALHATTRPVAIGDVVVIGTREASA